MKRIDQFCPPLAENILLENNFFELYPFDGGGAFIHHKILGSIDDEAIVRSIVKYDALAEFGGVRNIDFLKFERWSSIEKSCWMNRLYFVVSLARRYKITGDEKLAKLLKDILLHFKHDCPAPSDREAACRLETDVLYARDHDYNAKGNDFDAEISYQWFDFQPASRIVNILHALYFLQDSPSFSDNDWVELDELIFTHAEVIFWSEESHKPLAPGNHQALRGMALLLAAEYFADDPRVLPWRLVALRLCEYHILHDFLPDGMGIDLSPSYHFFETWIARDAVILADRRHCVFSDAVQERLKRAFAVCRALRQPDGFSTVISDGYSLDLEVFLTSLPPGVPVLSEMLLPDAGLALYSRDGDFILFDCSALMHKLAHFHGGKQAPTLFFGGQPFLVDSGCCSYDDAEFSEHYKQPAAHSTLLVDGQGDSVLQGRYTWLEAPKCRLMPWRNGTVESVLSSNAPGWTKVSWRRRITVLPAGVEISDAVEAQHKAELTFLFNLHPDVRVEISGCRVRLSNHSVTVSAEFPAVPALCDGLGFVNFRKIPCQCLVLRMCAAEVSFKSVFKREK